MQAPTSTPVDVTEAPPSRVRTTTGRHRMHPATCVHAASLVLGYLGLLWLLRGTWFRGDDFEFLANRVGADRSLSIWYPHNEHWSTGPIAIWRVLYSTVGIDSAVPYYAVSLLAHAAVAHLLWRLMRRARVEPWTATGLAAVFFFLGAGYENITWAFQLGFMGAFALGLAATVCCLRTDRVSTVAGLVFLLAALTFAGVALPFVVSSIGVLALQRRWLAAGGYAVVTGAVYGTWYVSWGSQAPAAPHSQPLPSRLAVAPGWAVQLTANGLEGLVSVPGTAMVLLAGMVLAIVLLWRRRVLTTGLTLSPRVLVCAVVSANLAVQAVTLAGSRADISNPDTSRYLYFVIALLLPVLGVLADHLRRWPGFSPSTATTGPRRSPVRPVRAGAAVVALIVVYLLAVQSVTLVARERQYEQPQLRADVQGLAALVAEDRSLTNPSLAVDLDVEAIDKWLREEALTGDEATPQAVLDAQAIGQVVVSADRQATGDGALTVANNPVPLGPASCVTTTPTPGGEAGIVDVGPGSTLSVTNRDPGNLSYQVLQGQQAGSRVIAVPASPHAPLWITATEPLTLRIVSETGSEATFCMPD